MEMQHSMMKSSNGNFFRVTGRSCGEFTCHWLSPRTKARDADFDVFFDLCLNTRLGKQPWGRWFDTPSCSLLWRHFDVKNGMQAMITWTFDAAVPLNGITANFKMIGCDTQ